MNGQDEKTNWDEEWKTHLAKLRSHFFAKKPQEWESMSDDDKSAWTEYSEEQFIEFIADVYPGDSRDACLAYRRGEQMVREALSCFCCSHSPPENPAKAC